MWLVMYRVVMKPRTDSFLETLVLLQVSVEVCLLPKATLTERTLERLLFVVDIANVPLQVAGDAEGALAILAFVGLFACVGT